MAAPVVNRRSAFGNAVARLFASRVWGALRGEVMGLELVKPSNGFRMGTPRAGTRGEPLEWYKVVGIELVLFAGTIVPVVYGVLAGR